MNNIIFYAILSFLQFKISVRQIHDSSMIVFSCQNIRHLLRNSLSKDLVLDNEIDNLW